MTVHGGRDPHLGGPGEPLDDEQVARFVAEPLAEVDLDGRSGLRDRPRRDPQLPVAAAARAPCTAP